MTKSELKNCLRGWRARLSPEDVGLPAGVRRRAAGLRREEVALLAGVSPTWYTWLEQGRPINVSSHFLDRLSIALKLDGAERLHLFRLTGIPAPEEARYRTPPITEGLKNCVDSVRTPAFLKDLRWDLLYWNKAAERLFGDLSWVPENRRNVLQLLFTDKRHQEMFINWERDAKEAIAKFRLDASLFLEDPVFSELIDNLNKESKHFRTWWKEGQVRGKVESIKPVKHPREGVIHYFHNSLSVEQSLGLWLEIYTPMNIPELQDGVLQA